MKKIITFVLCAILTVSLSTTAFAADMPFMGEGTSTLTYKSYSSCIVTIPETIQITGQSTEIIISNPNIESGYCVNVYVTNLSDENGIILNHDVYGEATTICAMLTNDSKNSAVDISNPLLASIEGSDIVTDILYGSFTVSAMGMDYRAGSYTGTMKYEFRIEPINE